MGRIEIDGVDVRSGGIVVRYSVSDDLEPYFRRPHLFYAGYSQSLEGVPPSVAVVPFLCNTLPIAWLTDSDIVLDEIDKDFHDSIAEFKKG